MFSKNTGRTVTALIEVQYEGPAHEFAWVLPVPAGEVEIGVGSTSTLDRLQQFSNPQYNLQTQFDDGCASNNAGASGFF